MKSETDISIKERVKKFYDEQWGKLTTKEALDRKINLNSIIKPLIEFSGIRDGDRIVDLGCGTGTLAIAIAELNKNTKIYGIDISRESLRVAKKIIVDLGLENAINLIEADIDFMPFLDNFFDLVVSQATINLLPDKMKAFNEISRITRKGGTIVISDCTSKTKVCGSDELWNKCITGAPSFDEFVNYASDANLSLVDYLKLTDEVRHLVEENLWHWPEFLEFDMEYFVFKLKKQN
ncbi:MAG: class I SAM-dependent methyltransferase [Candidatus Hydrothermarchaeota archaeon]